MNQRKILECLRKCGGRPTLTLPSKTTATHLPDIRHHIVLARESVTELDYAYRADLQNHFAVTRCLEILSEASRRDAGLMIAGLKPYDEQDRFWRKWRDDRGAWRFIRGSRYRLSCVVTTVPGAE
jgi:hypothetical protein